MADLLSLNILFLFFAGRTFALYSSGGACCRWNKACNGYMGRHLHDLIGHSICLLFVHIIRPADSKPGLDHRTEKRRLTDRLKTSSQRLRTTFTGMRARFLISYFIYHFYRILL